MILTIDAGNTETTTALFDGEEVRRHWRFTTGLPRTADEFSLLILSQLSSAGLTPADVEGSALCSVVPAITSPLAEACEKCFGVPPRIISATAGLPVKLEVDEPASVGADRVANTLATHRLYGRDSIVVDLGTATTYDCITAAGSFIGGIIQPGVLTSAETLFRRTAQLAQTRIVPPQKVIGTRTEECIRSGVLYGAADSVEGLVRRIKEEWGVESPLVLATGGLAATLRPWCPSFEIVDPLLTLKGIRIGYDLLA